MKIAAPTRPMSANTAEVLAALRQEAESEAYEDTKTGHKVRDVYLDNAYALVKFLTPHQFAGHLSALEAAGLYRGHGDDCFGMVAID